MNNEKDIHEQCDYIIENDCNYQLLLNENIESFNALKKALSSFENSTAKLLSYAECLMYRSGLNTGQKTKHKNE